ncbi:putative membrane protein [Pseudoloma neurophilia]|uniref:Putative membrane protein n=1 Tax=Pseudoloma neurophilia TaxID=146866 RepID=A0A0R0LS15_9MICR|nr:putative membrane protein [Pseudoloma neurophilia]
MAFFNLFKKQSLRDKLLNLDSQITGLEQFSEKLNKFYTTFYRISYLIGLFGISVVLYIFYKSVTQESSFPFIQTSLIGLFSIFSYSVISIILNFLRARVEKKITAKKNEQSAGILQYKQDQEYDEMIRIIEKYESNNQRKANARKSRSNLSHISDKNNQSTMSSTTSFTSKMTDKFKNMLLLNNPNEMIALICQECGEHNGLVFFKQYRPFKCISCKTYNEVTEYDFEDDGEEIVSRSDSKTT